MAVRNRIENLMLEVLHNHDDVRENLSGLLGGISKNTEALSELSDILEPLVTGFLFEKDKQLNIILNNGEADLSLSEPDPVTRQQEVFQNSLQNPQNPVLFHNDDLTIKHPGDIELHGIFERRKLEDAKLSKHKVNELEASLSIPGIPALERSHSSVKELLSKGNVKGFGLDGEEVHQALFGLFPNTTEVLKDIIDLENSAFHFSEGEGFIQVSMEGNMNMKGLKAKYENLANILAHIQHVNLDLLDPGEEYTKRPVGTEQEKALLKFIDDAHRGFKFTLDNRGGIPEYQITYTLMQDGDCLLWNDANGIPIPEKPFGFDITKPQRFMLLLQYSLRIKELGCATITMPRVVTNLQFIPYNNETSSEEAYDRRPGFHLTLHYFARQNFLTRMLVSPFMNLKLLRELLMMRFFVHIGHDTCEILEEPDVAQLNVNLRATLLPPPVVLSSCVKSFVRNHVKNQGDLLLYSHICGALSKDLMNLSPK